jgi:hypothetical protein
MNNSPIHIHDSEGARGAGSAIDDVRVRVLGHELPLALRVEDAARLVGVGRSSMYAAVKRGEFATVRIAGRTVVLTVPLLRRLGLDVAVVGHEKTGRRPSGDLGDC